MFGRVRAATRGHAGSCVTAAYMPLSAISDGHRHVNPLAAEMAKPQRTLCDSLQPRPHLLAQRRRQRLQRRLDLREHPAGCVELVEQ